MSVNVANGRWAGFDRAIIRRFGFPPLLAAVGVVFLSLLLTASGAYDTDDMALLHRWAFWLVFSILVVGQVCVLDHVLRRTAARRPGCGLLAGGAAVGITILLLAAELHGLKFTPLLPKDPDPFLEFILFIAPPVAAISIFALLIKNQMAADIGGGRQNSADASAMAAKPRSGGSEPQNQDYFPTNGPDARVLTVRAHDHYLEIVTTQGTRFVRGRMKDAVAHLNGARGVRAHRSWWVAAGEISGSRFNGRDYVLLLRGGSEIPVARSRVPALRRLGLL